MPERLIEFLEDVWGTMTVSRRVVLWIDRVHDYKHLLALARLAIERPISTINFQTINIDAKNRVFSLHLVECVHSI